MKTWWNWLILSAVWAVAAIVNAADGRSALVIAYDVLAAVLLAALALVQWKGSKRLYRWACIGSIAVLVLFTVVVALV